MSRAGGSITYDPRKFLDALKTVSREAGVSMSNLIRYQMALWVNDLIKRTAGDPKNTSGHRRAGQEAIRRDLSKIFVAIDNPSVLQKWQDAAKGDSIYRYNDQKKRFRVRAKLLKETMERWHTQNRDRRSGRTMKPANQADAWGGRMPVQTRRLEQFARKVSRDVGKTKAGWLVAANRFAAATQGIVTNMAPAWVARHAGWAAAYGDGYEQGSMLSGTITAVAVNKIPWARDWSGMMAATMRTRQLDIQRQMVKRVDTLKKLARL